MTDKAVSALTSLTGANTATGDLLYIVDISEAAAADRSKKITAEELQNYVKKFPATIGVGGATPAASGAGISFPATASASSDANTLDDYEEGTWTPTLPNGGTLNVESALYVKIGRLVTVTCYLTAIAPTNNSSDFRIGGLPFVNITSASYAMGGSFGYVGDSNLTGWLPVTGSTFNYFYFHSQSTTSFKTNADYLTAASGSVDAFIITMSYFAA